MSAEDDMAVVRRFYEAFQNRDVVRMRDLMTDDVVWAVPDATGVSRVRKGLDDVMLRVHQLIELSGDSFEMELLHLASDNGGCVIAIQRFEAVRGNSSLRMTEPVLFVLDGGRIAEFRNFYADPAAKDAFWAH